ncbi:MAG TPA: IS66 family transposase [Patescibacteria group bacterium]|nr:IS66 family transposase [Patescibacteria group bacterium]
MKVKKLGDGRDRVVRHGHGPEREIQTGIGPVAVSRVKIRDRSALAVIRRPWSTPTPRDAGQSTPTACSPNSAARRLSVYKTFALKHEAVTVAYSWAHVRRAYFEVAKPSAIAEDALKRIAALYAIEAEIRGQTAEQRKAVRQEKAKPLAEALKAWRQARLAEGSGKSPIAAAIRYTLNQWDGLVRFIDDERIEIDSNTIERSMRPIALGRKSWLFAGSDRRGQRAAALYSLIVTAKMNDVDPQAWPADVLARIAEQPAHRLDELLPWNWRPRPVAENQAA